MYSKTNSNRVHTKSAVAVANVLAYLSLCHVYLDWQHQKTDIQFLHFFIYFALRMVVSMEKYYIAHMVASLLSIFVFSFVLCNYLVATCSFMHSFFDLLIKAYTHAKHTNIQFAVNHLCFGSCLLSHARLISLLSFWTISSLPAVNSYPYLWTSENI